MNQLSEHKVEKTSQQRFCGRRILRGLVRGLIAAAVLTLVFWLVWNWAAVPLFTFPALTFVQSLVAILFTVGLVRTAMCAVPHRCRTGTDGRRSSAGRTRHCKPWSSPDA